MKPTVPLSEIEKEYRASIDIPAHPPQKQFVFCPVGLIGAGKTTITKPIAEALSLVRVSSDELRKILKENGHDYSSVKNICTKVAEELADRGFSIALDADCGSLETKALVESLAKKRNAPIFWVHVNTPEEFIFEKFRKHPPSWLADSPEIMIKNYKTQKERRIKEGTSFHFFHTFDTSRADVDKQINECIRKITAKLSK